MNPLIQRKSVIVLILLSLVCLGVAPLVKAVTPPPGGGYPNGNTAVGQQALLDLTTGGYNTAVGRLSLATDTDGDFNTAVGAGALLINSGDENTATGAAALFRNTTGEQNTADGTSALSGNITGNLNTAIGFAALIANEQGNGNTATGYSALASNTTGNNNTAIGRGALLQNTGGSINTAVGNGAGHAVVNANNVICIGFAVAGADVSNTTWIGNVYGVATQSGTTVPVVVSDTGQLGTMVSSERFKKDIATMDKASEAILSLRPVTFHYKTDVKGTPQFGLIAEEVANVNPALVMPDREGNPYTVRYDQVNAMLLNEFLKARRQIDVQQKQIDALTAGLQKVSAQIEVSKVSSQTVVNNR